MTDTESSNVGLVKDIPLGQIEIGQAQVRTDLSSGIEDLAQSIRRQGLLNPITVVCKADEKYEVLAGQRRFLACERLGHKTIRAIVRDADSVDDEARVAISLTENLVRRDNSQKELIDACTKLYKRYGSMKMVADETGLNPNDVSKYVKYDQLVPALKEKVDSAQLDMKVALQAQKAAAHSDGTIDEEAAQKFAAELAPLSNTARKSFVKAVESDSTASIEERIEKGRKQPVLKQVLVTLEESLHSDLQVFAKDEGINQDEAAAFLIEDGLTRRGHGEE